MINKSELMTTSAGNPVADNQNSITAGPRGPLLMQDYQLLEKLAHQNRERIPERTVHAKGSGAYGTLTITHDISNYSKASVFAKIGKKTECLLRFSTVAGERGAADAERDVRGFALKFYTDEGNWDMVGNNTPVFFVRDPYRFPDFIHTQKRHPKTNLRSNTAMWDFWSLSPESLHQVTILMSDRGLPRGFRHVNGYGSHTYSFINSKNERFWVKFHFKTLQGHKFWTNGEAERVVAKDRESSQRDLFEAIERDDFPKWRFCVQIMPEKDAETYRWNPFDLTKVWPHEDYSLIDVGVLELNRNPEHYFAGSSKRHSARRTSYPASAGRRTKCSRPVSFPTQTRIVTGWVRTTKCCRSTARKPACAPIMRTVQCGSTRPRARTRTINPTPSEARYRTSALPDRRSGFPVTPIATTIATTMMTTHSPAISFA